MPAENEREADGPQAALALPFHAADAERTGGRRHRAVRLGFFLDVGDRLLGEQALPHHLVEVVVVAPDPFHELAR
jgi:hypothetical protein